MSITFKDEEELRAFIKNEVLTSSETLAYLGISRQTLYSLVKRKKLVPVKELPRDRLFLKSDLDKRKEVSEELRPKYRPFEK